MLANILTGALIGIEAFPVQVEVNTGEVGELRLVLVGLPDLAVKESQDRVTSAISNSGFRMPETRTTINLAPGNIKKEGPVYDLPIALAILMATRQLQSKRIDDYLVGGELSLSGKTRPIRGALALAILAKKLGKKGVLLPTESASEAVLVEGVDVYAVDSLDQAASFLSGSLQLQPIKESVYKETHKDDYGVDFSEIKGQKALRRAIEVAVAGGHNILIIGPPGSGKSMVAKRIGTIMPPPTLDQFLEILSVQSAAGITLNNADKRFQRPFRSPHHTISDVGLLGGGSIPKPGEISLAHNGVLFMDELPEFKRSTLEVLRQPLEDGEVSISRSAAKIKLPSSIMLVAAMNPCPCGYYGDKKRECRCSVPQIQKYRSRISGPLLDRIDIHIEAPGLSLDELRSTEPGESSASIMTRIKSSKEHQMNRFEDSTHKDNARMNPRQIRKHCEMQASDGDLLQKAMEELNLSARAYDRILKVARTIADLANIEKIQTSHLLEAIQYRSLDRNLFY